QFCIEVAEALMMFGGHYHVFHARLLGEFCPGARGMRLRVENFRELLVFGDRNPFLFHGPLVPSEHAVKPEMDEHSETRFATISCGGRDQRPSTWPARCSPAVQTGVREISTKSRLPRR